MRALQKPAHGAPCNGCGQCCEDQMCPLGALVVGRVERGPCRFLGRGEDGTRPCRLVTEPQVLLPGLVAEFSREAVARAAATLIGSGMGCDAAVRGEPIDQVFRKRLYARAQSVEVQVARRIFGAPA